MLTNKEKSKKENKGFTLVELIVVIVILAILIGVTIGGIYQYVNKARINTDIHNAQEIKTALGIDFINGEYFNSASFRRRFDETKNDATSPTDLTATKANLAINDGDVVYIIKWIEYIKNQFDEKADKADFPTYSYIIFNNKLNNAWFLFKWLAYGQEWSNCSTQTTLNEIPLAQQDDYCFYFIFKFNEDGTAKDFDVICAPTKYETNGAISNDTTFWNWLMSYKR